MSWKELQEVMLVTPNNINEFNNPAFPLETSRPVEGADNDPCATCIWSPPSVFGGKPCFHCDTNDPLLNCYRRREEADEMEVL